MQRLSQTIYHTRKQAQGIILVTLCFAAASVAAQDDYLFEDFEGEFPSAWTVVPNWAAMGFDGWIHRRASEAASYFFPVTGNSKIVAVNDDACGQTGCNFADARLITPPIALPSGKTAYLHFDVFYRAGQYSSARESAGVSVSVNGGPFVALEGFAELSGKNAWRTLRANLSGYAGNVVQIMFRYSDGGGWADGVAFDNVRVHSPPPFDLRLFFVNLAQEEYVSKGEYRIVGGAINQGTQTLDGLTARWSVNGDEFRLAGLGGLSLAPFDTVYWQHPETLVLPAAGRYDLRVEISIDGTDDPTPADNAVEFSLYALDSVPYKTALMELFTSNTCEFCPFAHFWTDTLAKYYPASVVVRHHLEAAGPSALDIPESIETYFGLNQSLMPSVVFNRARLPLHSTIDPQTETQSLDAS
ncbi:MAG: immune inhibitor A, partial [Bacteroidia bacterium]|nr:immune inhibitor A [Bacteroidia bacterium]